MKKKTQRSIVAVVLLISFLLLLTTGVVMELTHRQADSHFYMGAHRLHNGAAIGFVIASVYHLVFNWRALMSYLRGSKG